MLKNRKKVLLLAAGVSLCLLCGCGDETVHTSAESQNAETEETAAEDMPADTEKTTADDDETGGVPKETGLGSEAQPELDDETVNELTKELLQENELDISVVENTKATKGCVFSIPEEFTESEDMPGMYVTEGYPIDASTIYYTVREKDISLQLMTQEAFEEQAEENFRQVYNQEIDFVIDEFERIDIEGYPAFRILCHYQLDDIMITQLEYVINADKSYVITYSQTNEYDRMDEYEASAATIRLEY